MQFIPIYLIVIPIFTAIIIYLAQNKTINHLALVAQGVVTILLITYRSLLAEVSIHTVLIGGWRRDIGISLQNDSLSFSFLALAIIIWWAVLIYDWNKRKGDSSFLFFLLFLEGVFFGLVQTNDFFNFFVFLEIATILPSILIISKKEGPSLRAGLYYLLFNTTGILMYLVGLALLYKITGTLNMELVGERIISFRDTSLIAAAYIFMMASMGVKSAFFPVYNWLPRAHGAAPTTISALLSGLLVKSGVYGFIRINQVFQLHDFQVFFLILGFVTALTGLIFALSQKDIKQILAFHTISQIGLILMGVSSMQGVLYHGGVFHIVNHAVFKSLLFLGAGVIISEYKTRNVVEIRGVFKRLPLTSIFMIVGMLSITGSPLFSGFISKSILGYGLKDDRLYYLLFNIINLGTMMSFLKMSQVFFGKDLIRQQPCRYPWETVSMCLLSFISLGIGLFYPSIAYFFWEINLDYVKIWVLNKWIVYWATMGIAYMVYVLLIKREGWVIKKLRQYQPSFEEANILLVLFIFLMMMFKSLPL